jgi:hypothetical protein
MACTCHDTTRLPPFSDQQRTLAQENISHWWSLAVALLLHWMGHRTSPGRKARCSILFLSFSSQSLPPWSKYDFGVVIDDLFTATCAGGLCLWKGHRWMPLPASIRAVLSVIINHHHCLIVIIIVAMRHDQHYHYCHHHNHHLQRKSCAMKEPNKWMSQKTDSHFTDQRLYTFKLLLEVTHGDNLLRSHPQPNPLHSNLRIRWISWGPEKQIANSWWGLECPISALSKFK